MISGIIYKATNKVNGKVYIGETTRSLSVRIYEHTRDTMSNRDKFHFHNALRKYSFDNFRWEILETCCNKCSLDLAEQWYIRFYSSHDKNKGYNMTLGGGVVNTVLSEEHKRKISKSNKGKKKSPEHVSKLRDGRCSKPTGSDSKHSKKFVITTPEGNRFMIHGLTDFCRNYREYSVDFRLLSAVAVGKRLHTKKHKCEYYDKIKHAGIKEWTND